MRGGEKGLREMWREEVRGGEEGLREEVRGGEEGLREVWREEVRVGEEGLREVWREEVRGGEEGLREVWREEVRSPGVTWWWGRRRRVSAVQRLSLINTAANSMAAVHTVDIQSKCTISKIIYDYLFIYSFIVVLVEILADFSILEGNLTGLMITSLIKHKGLTYLIQVIFLKHHTVSRDFSVCFLSSYDYNNLLKLQECPCATSRLL